VTRAQLDTLIRSLLLNARKEANNAKPGDPLFDVHMTAAVILSRLAESLMDLFDSTPRDDSFAAQPRSEDTKPTSYFEGAPKDGFINDYD
jgi:hypothetical protein